MTSKIRVTCLQSSVTRALWFLKRAWIQELPILFSLFVLLWSPPLSAAPLKVPVTLNRASALEAADKLDEAISLYRILHSQNPGRNDILLRLESLLSRTGLHEESVALLQSRLKFSPNDINFRLRLGDAYYALNRQDMAFDSWNRILESATSAGSYAIVADRYRRRNLDQEAASIFKRGRKDLDEPFLFALELAELAEGQTHYFQAVQEYLLLLQDKPQYRSITETRLREFAREGIQQDEIFSLLAGELKKRPDDFHIRLLVEFSLPAGLAAQLLVELEADPADDTAHLLRIGDYTRDQKSYATSIRAYQTLIDRSSNPMVIPKAMLGRAQAMEGLQQSSAAREGYRSIISTYPRLVESDESYFRLGLLLRDADANPEAAQRTFGSLIKTGRRTPWRYKALFEFAEGLFQADGLDDALLAYSQIIQERKGHQDERFARYRSAELRFLSGQIDTARTLLDQLLAGSVTHTIINDAIDLSVFIQQEKNLDLLRSFASAQKQKRLGNHRVALAAFRALSNPAQNSSLVDRILFAQVELQESLGQFTKAIQACRLLIATLDWSPLCPRAQLTIARIYGDRLGQYLEAKKAYEDLLIEYPESIETDRAREHLRNLQDRYPDLEAKPQTG